MQLIVCCLFVVSHTDSRAKTKLRKALYHDEYCGIVIIMMIRKVERWVISRKITNFVLRNIILHFIRLYWLNVRDKD